MLPDFVAGSPLWESLWAVGVFVASILVAWLVLLIMKYARRKLEKRRETIIIQKLLQYLSKPIFLIISSQGLILALNSVSYLTSWRPYLGKAAIALAIIFIAYGLAHSGRLLLDWYLRKARVRQSLSRLVQRIAIILIYVGGLLVLLDYLGISISPMIAGLGIGGLAIALALQTTLSNFFAGTQIVSDHVVRVGDYIELGNGEVRGYVADIGWRSTRIRTTFNNLVIVPNSRLADSIITNYHGPSMELAVIVDCGVSYSSNLADVEEIALDVTRGVVNDLDEAVKTFEPWFGYDEFGDSNINFWIWLQATDRIASFRVKSELIKRLHTRFDKEGITINYPVRTTHLHWAGSSEPPVFRSESNPGGSD